MMRTDIKKKKRHCISVHYYRNKVKIKTQPVQEQETSPAIHHVRLECNFLSTPHENQCSRKCTLPIIPPKTKDNLVIHRSQSSDILLPSTISAKVQELSGPTAHLQRMPSSDYIRMNRD